MVKLESKPKKHNLIFFFKVYCSSVACNSTMRLHWKLLLFGGDQRHCSRVLMEFIVSQKISREA